METLGPDERLKNDSNQLRGTIPLSLMDPLTGAVTPVDQKLMKFHGIYQQDDRDVRDERRRQKLEPQTKLFLLENEENLFDLGLYIGLAGTVASLILLAMDIAQVSLVSAYSSTLFGILFGAALKILHVRAYRRQLILEQIT